MGYTNPSERSKNIPGTPVDPKTNQMLKPDKQGTPGKVTPKGLITPARRPPK